jgi:ribonuclease-3
LDGVDFSEVLIVAALPPARQHQLQRCVQKLGLPEATHLNWNRLDIALTHVSADPIHNYEQLELLGDAVLRLAATECLQDQFPDATVGELSALRSILTSDRTLAQLAETLGLGRYLQLSEAARKDTLGQPARLADAFEAVLAALYLENHTLSLIRPWLDPHLQRKAREIQQDPARQNPKVRLQELTQAHTKTRPTYRTVEQRPIDGDPQRFRSEVWFQETCWATGYGSTKKQAEQDAAAAAYDMLHRHLLPDTAFR